jgi:general stress protein 26
MPSSPPASVSSLLAVALFAIPSTMIAIQSIRKKRQQSLQAQDLETLSKALDALRPPLPPVVQKLLQACRLAYLSTVDTEAGTSHLSLMRFTYLPSEEVIVMSTNMHTKKYDMLLQQRGVALLVHDFGTGNLGEGGELSATLNGTCSIVSDADTRERYQKAHLKHNPDYPQFIVGPDIAILCVDVKTARICNIADQVIHYNIQDGAKK